MERQKWQVDPARAMLGEYRMICQQCGHSFTSDRIEARSRCDYCGTVYGSRDRFFMISADGKQIEEISDDQSNHGTDDQHNDIVEKALPGGFSFLRKIRKIILAKGGKRH